MAKQNSKKSFLIVDLLEIKETEPDQICTKKRRLDSSSDAESESIIRKHLKISPEPLISYPEYAYHTNPDKSGYPVFSTDEHSNNESDYPDLNNESYNCELNSGNVSRSSRSRSQSKSRSRSRSSSSSSCNLKKNRKSRTAFSDHQLNSLEKSFEKHKYLSVQDRIELAARLSLTDTQVKTWYQNRR